MRVLEFRLGESLMVVYSSVANELHLGHPRDGLEIRVKNRLFRLASLVVPMTVALRKRVKRLGIGMLVGMTCPQYPGGPYLCQSILLLW